MTEQATPQTRASERFDLEGQSTLITGGCGGLGSAIAAGFAAAGADVAVADIALEDADADAAAIETHGRRGLAVDMNVTDSGSIQAGVDRVLREFGRIDVLVNSHGVTRRMPAAEFAEDAWDRIIEVNLKGVFLCCQIVGREMIRQGSGSIVNLASRSGGWSPCR